MKSTISPPTIRKLITVALIASMSAGVLLNGNAIAYVKSGNSNMASQTKRLPSTYPNLRLFARD
jgi:hypothetical protein